MWPASAEFIVKRPEGSASPADVIVHAEKIDARRGVFTTEFYWVDDTIRIPYTPANFKRCEQWVGDGFDVSCVPFKIPELPKSKLAKK